MDGALRKLDPRDCAFAQWQRSASSIGARSLRARNAMLSRVMADEAQPPRKLTPEAQRALAEAEERRAAAAAEERAKEVGGPSGPEPTRFGDWERKGIASDF